MRYWVGVVVRDHVMVGVEGGFCQLSHGKRAPVSRLSPGDWLAYYAPRTAIDGGKAVQAFVAIGQVADGAAYEFPVSEDFRAWRRDVIYADAQEALIRPLLDDLSFITNRRYWGMAFRRSAFEVTAADFKMISAAMGISVTN